MHLLIPLARACTFANSTDSVNNILNSYYVHSIMSNIMEDLQKAQISVYLQGVHGLVGKTEVYANNYYTGTCPFEVPG